MEEYVTEALDAGKDELILESLDLEEEAEYRGFNEGKAEGKAEGETKAHVEDAKKMLADNLDINLISKYTGLSVEKIELLRKE